MAFQQPPKGAGVALNAISSADDQYSEIENRESALHFRRKINDYVVETEQVIEGAGHRPAKLFKRNVEEFYR